MGGLEQGLAEPVRVWGYFWLDLPGMCLSLRPAAPSSLQQEQLSCEGLSRWLSPFAILWLALPGWGWIVRMGRAKG